MRGSDERTGELFSYVDIEERVPQNHPLRCSHPVGRRRLPQLFRTALKEWPQLTFS